VADSLRALHLVPPQSLLQVDREFMSDGVQGQLSSAREELELEIHKKMMRANATERRAHFTSLAVDALIMAQSAAFVGQFRSHLSRFFFELASQQQGRMLPFVSVDGAPW
jgi:hypothetical protein